MTNLQDDINLRAFCYFLAMDTIYTYCEAHKMETKTVVEITTDLAAYLVIKAEAWLDDFYDPSTWELSLTEETTLLILIHNYMDQHPELLEPKLRK